MQARPPTIYSSMLLGRCVSQISGAQCMHVHQAPASCCRKLLWANAACKHLQTCCRPARARCWTAAGKASSSMLWHLASTNHCQRLPQVCCMQAPLDLVQVHHSRCSHAVSSLRSRHGSRRSCQQNLLQCTGCQVHRRPGLLEQCMKASHPRFWAGHACDEDLLHSIGCQVHRRPEPLYPLLHLVCVLLPVQPVVRSQHKVGNSRSCCLQHW